MSARPRLRPQPRCPQPCLDLGRESRWVLACLFVLSCGGWQAASDWPSSPFLHVAQWRWTLVLLPPVSGLLTSHSEALHRLLRAPVCLPSPSQRLDHAGLAGAACPAQLAGLGVQEPGGTCGKRRTPIFLGTLCQLFPEACRPKGNTWGHTALCLFSGQSWDPTLLGPA